MDSQPRKLARLVMSILWGSALWVTGCSPTPTPTPQLEVARLIDTVRLPGTTTLSTATTSSTTPSRAHTPARAHTHAPSCARAHTHTLSLSHTRACAHARTHTDTHNASARTDTCLQPTTTRTPCQRPPFARRHNHARAAPARQCTTMGRTAAAAQRLPTAHLVCVRRRPGRQVRPFHLPRSNLSLAGRCLLPLLHAQSRI